MTGCRGGMYTRYLHARYITGQGTRKNQPFTGTGTQKDVSARSITGM